MAASVANAANVNPDDIKMLLANDLSTLFINIKPNFIHRPRKLSNSPSCPTIFPVVSSNKIPLFSKELITFMISFISLFVSVIPDPYIFESPSNFFLLPRILSPTSTKRFLTFSFNLGTFFLSSFLKEESL